MSETLKYVFLAERETFLRVFELNAGISAIPAIAPNAPQAIMLLEALRITKALPFRFSVRISICYIYRMQLFRLIKP
jgi:hypothetical protein